MWLSKYFIINACNGNKSNIFNIRKQRLTFNSILSNARTLTAEGIHQVHFSSEGRSLILAGNRRMLINFKNIKFLSTGKIYSHHIVNKQLTVLISKSLYWIQSF